MVVQGSTQISSIDALNTAIETADGLSGGTYTITLTASVALDGNFLETINLHSGVTLDIDGAGFTPVGSPTSPDQGLFVYAGTVDISNPTIEHMEAVGGTGGADCGGPRLRFPPWRAGCRA